MLSLRGCLVAALVVGSSAQCGNQVDLTERVISTTDDRAVTVRVADVDGDGDVDVLSASNSNQIRWYENDGAQSFALHQISDQVGGVYNVFVGDIDADGDLDLAACGLNDDTVSWFENDASESFTRRIIASAQAMTPTATRARAISRRTLPRATCDAASHHPHRALVPGLIVDADAPPVACEHRAGGAAAALNK